VIVIRIVEGVFVDLAVGLVVGREISSGRCCMVTRCADCLVVVGVGLGDRLLQLFETGGQMRAGQLGQRLAGAVFMRVPARGMGSLAGRDDEPGGVLLGADDDQRASVELAFLVPRPRLP
jgi:hypothetical protein